MKSLIEESSSIAKAIEKGWERAGKPQSFSIKIFELPEKNFLGMTTKYAKVGIFFAEEKNTAHHAKKEAPVATQKTRRPDTAKEALIHEKKSRTEIATESTEGSKNRPHKNQQSKKEQNPRPMREKDIQTTSSVAAKEKEVPTKPSNTWSDDMVAFVRQWLESNPLITQKNIHFTTTTNQGQLLIALSTPLTTEASKQITLFRSFSYLIMASLKTKFKKDLKGLRVMLSCE